MNSPDEDTTHLRHAVQLAMRAEQRGNLPIGAVIALNGKIIAEGMNTIWQPAIDLTRHAEMEALRSVPQHLWSRSREMTLYTTLEPCLMCAAAILMYQIGRLVFGATDPYGGVRPALESLPPFFSEQFMRLEWAGPALPDECDALYVRVRELMRNKEGFH